MLRPPISTLFPYTTLFRSCRRYGSGALHSHPADASAGAECVLRAHQHLRGTPGVGPGAEGEDRKSTRLNSSHMSISYAVFCLKKKIMLITFLKASHSFRNR